jgi:hypothetical protein
MSGSQFKISQNRKPDHFVYAVKDFDHTLTLFENWLGIRPVIGGKHVVHGTKNALINLGDCCYLEIIAPDEENKDCPKPRWMGVDQITSSTITRWAVKSETFVHDCEILHTFNPLLGIKNTGQRKTLDGDMLSWQMTMPASSAEIDVVPFVIDWTGSTTHPTADLLPDCQLAEILIFHPFPDFVQPILDKLGIEILVKKASDPRINIRIKHKTGTLVL